MANSGKITQIIGPVVDVVFEKENTLPEILNALEKRTNELKEIHKDKFDANIYYNDATVKKLESQFHEKRGISFWGPIFNNCRDASA